MKLKLLIKSPKDAEKESGPSATAAVDPAHYSQSIFEWDQAICMIGRTEGQLVLHESRCSSQHALLYESYSGELKIRDLDSRNGTFYQKHRITEVSLVVGDELRIGKTFIVVLDFQPSTTVQGEDGEPPIPRQRRNEENTVSETAVILKGPNKIFKCLPPEMQSKFIDYADKDGTRARIPIKDIKQRKERK